VNADEKRQAGRSLDLAMGLFSAFFMVAGLVGWQSIDRPSVPQTAPSGTQQQRQLATNSLPQAATAQLLRDLTGAELPAEAQDIYGHSASLFTTVTYLRFSCSEQAFWRMQVTSLHLGTMLNPDEKLELSEVRFAWWKPEELIQPQRRTGEWSVGADTVSCALMSGRTTGSTNLTVYLRFMQERAPR